MAGSVFLSFGIKAVTLSTVGNAADALHAWATPAGARNCQLPGINGMSGHLLESPAKLARADGHPRLP